MGIYRDWNIYVKSKTGASISERIEELEQRLKDLDLYTWGDNEFDWNYSDRTEYMAYLETYSHNAVQDIHNDLLAVSKEFPDLIFKVLMNSEDETHIQAIYNNGEFEEVYAELVYPAFKRLSY